jgi:hypothetical protein
VDEFQEAHLKTWIQPSTIQQSSYITIAEVEEFRILFQLGLKRATSHMLCERNTGKSGCVRYVQSLELERNRSEVQITFYNDLY